MQLPLIFVVSLLVPFFWGGRRNIVSLTEF